MLESIQISSAAGFHAFVDQTAINVPVLFYRLVFAPSGSFSLKGFCPGWRMDRGSQQRL
jgi:hypothetical protein